MSNGALKVGLVSRANTRGFAIGCRVLRPDIPAFGSFVHAEGQSPGRTIYGLIYDVSVEDDLFVRQIISADLGEERETVVLDNRENRQVPIEVSVLAVGYGDGETVRQCLPPQPPITLDWLYQCADDEVRAFTARFDYFRLVLDAPDVPVDELLAASLRAAAAVRGENERETFLVEAGRELARLLAGDPVRLEGLLRRLHNL